jgi:hypothetical protein
VLGVRDAATSPLALLVVVGRGSILPAPRPSAAPPELRPHPVADAHALYSIRRVGYTIQEGRDVVVDPGHGRGADPQWRGRSDGHGARCVERTVRDAGERIRSGAGDAARGGVGRAPGGDPVDGALEPARHPITDLERIVRPSADVPLCSSLCYQRT